MTYGKKPANKFSKKPGFGGNGGKKAYVPTQKDAFNSFVASLIGLPFRVINNPEFITQAQLAKVAESFVDKKITLRAIIIAILGVTDPAQIEEALPALFDPDNEGEVKNLSFKLNSFEKMQANAQEPYKSLNLEFVEAVRSQYPGGLA